MAGKEELILRELTSNRVELNKQKKRMKCLVDMIEEQFDITKKIAEKLQLEEDNK